MKREYSDRKMADGREVLSAGSQSSYATNLYGFPAGDQNSFQMLTGLYKELEPQLCKSYRRHVVYIPSDEPEPKRVTVSVTDKKKNKLKAVNMALDVVSELQRKKDIAKGKKDGAKGDLKDTISKVSDMTKNVSQSLPSLLEPTSS